MIFSIDGSSLFKVIDNQNTLRMAKTCLLMFASLVTLDSFYLLLSTQLTIDFTPEWSSGSMFLPLSHIYVKTPFYCIETVANNALNCEQVVFDWLRANAAKSLNVAFTMTNVHAKWHIHCLLISSTTPLFHTTSIYNWPKWFWGVFCFFPGQFPNLDNLSVRHHLKSAYHLLTIVSNGAESK